MRRLLEQRNIRYRLRIFFPSFTESVKQIVPDRKRSFSMFPERKGTKENLKPRRRRAETDQSVRNELSRQQLAEDRRKKLAAATDKPKREIRPLNLVHGKHGGNSHLGKFVYGQIFLPNYVIRIKVSPMHGPQKTSEAEMFVRCSCKLAFRLLCICVARCPTDCPSEPKGFFYDLLIRIESKGG